MFDWNLFDMKVTIRLEIDSLWRLVPFGFGSDIMYFQRVVTFNSEGREKKFSQDDQKKDLRIILEMMFIRIFFLTQGKESRKRRVILGTNGVLPSLEILATFGHEVKFEAADGSRE